MMDGRPLRDSRALITRVALSPVGQVLKLTAVRDGKEIQVSVRIEEQTDAKMNRLSGVIEIPEWGMEATPMTRAVAIRLRVDPRIGGVIITSVSRKGKAAEFGLEPGDIIRKINKRDVTTPEELQAYIKSGKPLQVIIRRGSENLMLEVEQ